MAQEPDRSTHDDPTEIGRATDEDVTSTTDDHEEFEDTEDLDEPNDDDVDA